MSSKISLEDKTQTTKVGFNWASLMKILTPALGILAGALVGSIVIVAKGVNPVTAYYYLLEGAFGSLDNFTASLIKSIPLGLTGLAVALSYKAGIFNIGCEGQLYLAAVGATVVGTSFAGLPSIIHIPLAILAGALLGGLYALIPGILKAYKGFNEIVITMLMNYIAIYFVSYLVQGPIKMPDQFYPQSAPILESARLPFIIPGTRLHAGFLIVLALAVLLWWVFNKTTFGFQIRGVGLNQRAMEYGGTNSKQLLVKVMFLSGCIAGIAGAGEILGVHMRLLENFSVNVGYDAIAVALLADLNPLGVLLSALFFGSLRNGANSMQISTGIPTAFVTIVQALAVLFVVMSAGLPRILKKWRRMKANA
ncbi:MAG: ABC transporter permease [Zhaonellaceae bacterium]|jgi:ABC-type uncharacterized transport system permease subunit